MTESPTVSAELLNRYGRPGPRYTSYPTAPHFTADFGVDEFRRFALAGGAAGRPLSLYIHIPFCSSPCLYCGCNRVITHSAERAAAYVSRLLREIELIAPLFHDREVVQLHFGGGTPNFLRPVQLEMLIESLGQYLRLSTHAQRDFSIEIDPRFVQPADFPEFARIGFNRVSFGVQDLDPEVQRAVNRVQSEEQTFGAIDACRAAGIDAVNVDLMYGLPRQTLERFRRTLDAVIAARPARLAVYGYAHMPQIFKPQRRIRGADLPDAATRVGLLTAAIEGLSAAGYRYIGMDHFALADDGLVRAQETGTLHRNFMGYTTHAGCDLLGIGASAISHLGESFSQNCRQANDWADAIDEGRLPLWRGLVRNRDDQIRAHVIDRIMCQGEVSVTEMEERYGIDFWRYFADARQRLAPLEADHLVWVCASRIMATPSGRYLLRALASCFDRYLHGTQPVQDAGVMYSKVV
ncbi:MAG TPA: oxygen-independent coproporphyrinogen III oxidase [Steroidobacteraceae bacterium]|nr:oxygen-independent coproporphyrinogen III oxidase [Steroidobacteraceae bacterium]